MTDRITIPRALLEQALKAIVPNTPAKISLKSAIRAELARPVEPATPAWHDAPTEPGLWFNSINHYAELVSQHWIDRGVVANSHARWYGPIPEDSAKTEGGAA